MLGPAVKELIALGARAPWRVLPLNPAGSVVTLISAHRYAYASAWRWNPGWWANTNWKQYAKRNVGPARSTVYLYREVLKLKDPCSEAFYAQRVGDHINGQPLDNRDENLRWATVLENNLNRIAWEDVPTIEEIVAGLLTTLAAEIPFP